MAHPALIATTLALLGAPSMARETPPLSYDRLENWVCHPAKPAACAFDLSATEIAPDGSTRVLSFRPAEQPKADCFYVYPTVSHGPEANAPPVVSEDERQAVRQQFARFASVCRLFAPLYRQVTVTAMLAGAKGETLPGTAEAGALAQADVDEAWRTYLSWYNQRRGVILIGHSQGAAMLTSLMQRQIDGAPDEKRLISAVLPGAWVFAPKGADVGGTFKSIPACRRIGQTGCVITYGSYWSDHPVPADRVPSFGERRPLCTNPAKLAGGQGVIAPIVSATGETIIPELSGPQMPWLEPAAGIATPFVSLPAQYAAECRDDSHGVWLAISKLATPGAVKVAEPTGEWLTAGTPDPTMGLHLIDLNLLMGDLLSVTAAQVDSYERAGR